MEEHIKFAAELGYLVARAKFAAENPQLEVKHGFWRDTSQEEKLKLFTLGDSFEIETLIT